MMQFNNLIHEDWLANLQTGLLWTDEIEANTLYIPVLYIYIASGLVGREATSNYIPHCLHDVINFPCPWYLLLARKSSYTVNSKLVSKC